MDYGDYPSAGMSAGIISIYLVIVLLMLISMWKIFTKAGKPGWAAIIPIQDIWGQDIWGQISTLDNFVLVKK